MNVQSALARAFARAPARVPARALAHAYEIKYRNGMMRLAPEENRRAGFTDPVNRKRQRLPTPERLDVILTALKQGPMTSAEVAKIFGWSIGYAGDLLRKERQAGTIACDDSERPYVWMLP